MSYKRIKITVLTILLLLPLYAMAKPTRHVYLVDQGLYDDYPNSVLYYYGVTISDPLIAVFKFEFSRWPEHINAIEIAHTLCRDNIFRQMLAELPLQLALNFVVRDGANQPTIFEIDPFVIFRWANFIWNDTVTTSLAIGEGISYASSIPAVEQRDHHHDHSKRLLNYLMLEATFAVPAYPRLQLALRVHHRSGAYGLYHAGNSGSNVIGLGLRYLF